MERSSVNIRLHKTTFKKCLIMFAVTNSYLSTIYIYIVIYIHIHMWFAGYSHLPSEMHIQLGSPSPSRQQRRRQCRVGARWRALACAGDADGYGGGGGVVPGSLVLLVDDCRGVSINGGTPIAGWFISWNIPRKNGWFRGTPISGNLHIQKYIHRYVSD